MLWQVEQGVELFEGQHVFAIGKITEAIANHEEITVLHLLAPVFLATSSQEWDLGKKRQLLLVGSGGHCLVVHVKARIQAIVPTSDIAGTCLLHYILVARAAEYLLVGCRIAREARNEHHTRLTADQRVVGKEGIDLVVSAHNVKDCFLTPPAIRLHSLRQHLDMAKLDVIRVGEQ